MNKIYPGTKVFCLLIPGCGSFWDSLFIGDKHAQRWYRMRWHDVLEHLKIGTHIRTKRSEIWPQAKTVSPVASIGLPSHG